MFVAPLAVVAIAVVAFWRRQVWKFRARDWRFKAKVREDTLNSLAHETANGMNAIRANLAGKRRSRRPRSADLSCRSAAFRNPTRHRKIP
jgi:hypothetical protein